MITGIETLNRPCDPDHAPFRGGLSSVDGNLIQSTCTQNLTILASAVLEISLGPQKCTVGHVTLTTPF